MQIIAQTQTIAAVRDSRPGSGLGLRAGRILSGIAVLILTLDSIGKLLQVDPVVEGTIALGYPVSVIFGLGVTLLLCVIAYVVPATSPLGAVLLTGYLGGAVATHLRVGDPLFTHVLFPVYMGALLWGGLLLRDPRARTMVPWSARDDGRTSGGDRTMIEAISRDGTRIACERSGRGPSLIIVDGALCSRAFGPSAGLANRLAPHFTVYRYDRRGRGESGDTHPYAREREVEDIAAIIRLAGEPVFLLGLSSGAALALDAAASGLEIRKVVAYEPPYVNDGGRDDDGHERRLRELVAAGNRGGAVTYFMRSMVQVPWPVVVFIRVIPWVWRRLKAVAHTLPYDAAVMSGFRVPRERLQSVTVPAMAMNGSKTDPRLKAAARAVADAVPGARHVVLEGQTHNVRPGVLVPAVVDFFLD